MGIVIVVIVNSLLCKYANSRSNIEKPCVIAIITKKYNKKYWNRKNILSNVPI